MNDKKPYTTPQIFRVELNHEQAVLAACSLTATMAMGGAVQNCTSGGCKFSANMGDSAGRAS